MNRLAIAFALLFSLAVWNSPALAWQLLDTKTAEGVFQDQDDSAKQVDQALEKAKQENRRVLVHWGTNDNPTSQQLSEAMNKSGTLRRLLMYEYDVVHVAAKEQNQKLAQRMNTTLDEIQLPRLVILDAAGHVIAQTSASDWKPNPSKEDSLEPLLTFLKEHQADPKVAAEVVAAGVERATRSKKLVLLHFGAPWCGWCHYMEDWMAQPEIRELLGREFVDVKVDTDRMKGGQETYEKYCGKPGGIPWFAFLNDQGEVLVDSTGPDGNVGFPSTDDEIGYFVEMLKKTERFKYAEMEFIRKSLVANRKAREERRKQ